MSDNSPVFRWDAYGISAYDAYWSQSGSVKQISGINSKRFVRFDKNGIYGIANRSDIDGTSWYPRDDIPGKTALDIIDEVATFSLTWKGLKVTNNSATVRIGNYSWDGGPALIKVNDGTRDTFIVDPEGKVKVRGELDVDSDKFSWKFSPDGGMFMWNGP